MLSDAELEIALSKLEKRPPGIYTAKALYGAAWAAITHPRCFGQRFKLTVLRGALPRLRWVRKRRSTS
jgi:hypothetical protein